MAERPTLPEHSKVRWTRREALYGKHKGVPGFVPESETEGKETRPKLTGGDRAEPANPNRKPPKLGGK